MNDTTSDPAREAAEGEALKQRAHALLSARRCSLVTRAQRVLLGILLEQGECTIDAVRATVAVPKGIDPKCFGAVPGPLSRAGIIYSDGIRKSSRRCAHARSNTVWKVRNAAAALEWLRLHPEPAATEGGE